MVLGKTLVYDAQKLSSKVCFYVSVPWGVVPRDVSFTVLSASSCLVCFWIVYKLKILSTFINCVLIGGDGCIEDFFTG